MFASQVTPQADIDLQRRDRSGGGQSAAFESSAEMILGRDRQLQVKKRLMDPQNDFLRSQDDSVCQDYHNPLARLYPLQNHTQACSESC